MLFEVDPNRVRAAPFGHFMMARLHSFEAPRSEKGEATREARGAQQAYPTCCPLVRFSKMLRATGHARMVKQAVRASEPRYTGGSGSSLDGS